VLLCFIKLILGITDPVLPGETRSTHPRFGIAEFSTRDPMEILCHCQRFLSVSNESSKGNKIEKSQKSCCVTVTVGLECFST